MSGMGLDRRSLLAAGPLLLAAIAAGDKAGSLGDIKLAPPPEAGPDPGETFVQPYQSIGFEPWGNLPPHSGEMAMLYGDFNSPRPYLVLMKWNPGWFSAPHTYATDRIQVVVFGTWFVNSGNDFQPQDAVPVGPGGYVKRTARTHTTTAYQPTSPIRPLLPSSALALSTFSWSTRASHHGVRCDDAELFRHAPLLWVLDGKPQRAHRARQVHPEGLLGPLEIAVAHRFGDSAMLVHDRRGSLIVHHQFTVHSRLTVAQ